MPVPNQVTKDRNRATAVREGRGQKVEDLKLPMIKKLLGCFIFKQLGSCTKGDVCPYSHDSEIIAETKLPPGYVARAQKLLAVGVDPQDDESFLEEVARDSSVICQDGDAQDAGAEPES